MSCGVQESPQEESDLGLQHCRVVGTNVHCVQESAFWRGRERVRERVWVCVGEPKGWVALFCLGNDSSLSHSQ